MYISKVKIVNYKGFKNIEVAFKDGLNVIIGHNNAGKSSLLEAIALVIDSEQGKRLSVWDFHQGMELESLKLIPPSVTISLFFSMSDGEDFHSSDVALFSSYALTLSQTLESCITYEFYLPKSEHKLYTDLTSNATSVYEIMKIIENYFIRKYTYSIYGGKPSLHQRVSSEDIHKIDFQKVDALRNVENELFSRKAELLHDVLAYFLDYNIKKSDKSKEEKDRQIKKLRDEFQSETKKNIHSLIERIKEGKDEILRYADNTGALYQSNDILFDGTITEEELIKVLNISVSSPAGYHVPISNNGLGYNNLIFMSLLLAKMQSNKEISHMGTTNAKAFSVLCLEEPEAHLHPELQYHFLKFLRQNIADGKVKQIFVTSHSSSLTARVKLDELCCLFKDKQQEIKAYYPRVIYRGDENSNAMKYVQRYIDATRADIFFAGKILFVEGLSEQILIPVFIRLLGYEDDWLKQQAVIINLGGRYFDHFLKMYEDNEDSLPIRVACITDRDPERKIESNTFRACWPVEYEEDSDVCRNHSDRYVNSNAERTNIRFFSQDKYGKTFEYEIARFNASNPVIVTESMSNKDELKNMISAESLSDTYSKCKSKHIIEVFKSNTTWDDKRKQEGLIAARYFESLSKGVHALELADVLSELEDSERSEFYVPTYIIEAIKWLLEKS